ncbi:MAG: thiamine pyrophosphate-binding protein [Smithella sp.]
MIKVSDFIVKYLASCDEVAKDVFLVSGGGMMHNLDSVGRSQDIRYICNHHEQACAIAAEGYARVSNKVGVAFVTTGPGGTNAITGVMGAWVDSIPTLTISGQVKVSTTVHAEPGLRQLGDQEINIIDIVKPITKYAVMVTDKSSIKYHLQKAIYFAKSGRFGPVWIDVPLDIQAALVEEEQLESFDASEMGAIFDKAAVEKQIAEIMTFLKTSKRPTFIVGNGVRLAEAEEKFLTLAERSGIPVLTTISGVDLISSDHPLFFGRPGILGARAANFIMQNSDLLIVIGTRMNLRIIGYAFEAVAREAVKIMVDIDSREMGKYTFRPDLKICSDAGYFIDRFLEAITRKDGIDLDINQWLDYCGRLRKQYPTVTDEHRAIQNYVSSYYFAEVLSDCLPNDAVVVTGNGTAYTSTFQAFPIKKGQRLFANVGCAAMGYDLPAAIGACFANHCKDVVCVTGDGSIQMNLQELQTIVYHQLPIKIFMFENQGYVSIKNTQDNFFGGYYTGSESSSGVSIPNMLKIAQAYGIPVEQVENHKELKQKIEAVLQRKGPVLCEVVTDPHEKLYPKAFSEKKPDGSIVSRPLEDLNPFLPREEFYKNMIIKPIG